VRAIKIDWNNGKRTVLLTSLSTEVVGNSEVVKAYFDRWPNQELPFRAMKSVACLHRVAGYGKQENEDTKVVKRQEELKNRIVYLKKELEDVLEKISQEEEVIARLVKKEYQLRKRSTIVEGSRIMLKEDAFFKNW